MLEILFSTSFFLFSGNIIDTKLTHHKYEKENYKEIFSLKNKESVNTYCVKHSEIENIKKSHIHDGVALTKYLFWIKNNLIVAKDNTKAKTYLSAELLSFLLPK